jgi:hypothetical protein
MTLVAMPNADEAQRTLYGLPDLYIALDHSSHRVLSYVPVLDGAEGVCILCHSPFSEESMSSMSQVHQQRTPFVKNRPTLGGLL